MTINELKRRETKVYLDEMTEEGIEYIEGRRDQDNRQYRGVADKRGISYGMSYEDYEDWKNKGYIKKEDIKSTIYTAVTPEGIVDHEITEALKGYQLIAGASEKPRLFDGKITPTGNKDGKATGFELDPSIAPKIAPRTTGEGREII